MSIQTTEGSAYQGSFRSAQDQKIYELFEFHLKKVQGKTLTVVEAALTGEQLKAVKDLIKQQFNSQLKLVFEVFSEGRLIAAEGEDLEAGLPESWLGK